MMNKGFKQNKKHNTSVMSKPTLKRSNGTSSIITQLVRSETQPLPLKFMYQKDVINTTATHNILYHDLTKTKL